MRNEEPEEPALVNIERNPLFLLSLALGSALSVYFAYQLLKDVNPLGFLAMVPAAILSFQCLWLMLNPFALIYEKKVEIRQSFLHRKARYYVDIKKVTEAKNGRIYITYNDDEVERINLFGIKNSHVRLFKEEFEKLVMESLKTRV